MPSAQKTGNPKQNIESAENPYKELSMPRTNSAGVVTTSGVKTPQEYPEFIKQALLVIEKKVRNLEKRRTKIDQLNDLKDKGQTLNADQLIAVSKHEEVRICLDLVKELDKQLVGLAADALKAQKKQAKKEQQEREDLVKEKLKEVQRLQAVLNTFGDEKVRQDFLDGKSGINPLTKEELGLLDDFDKLANTQLSKTCENEINDIADHYLNLIEAKNKPILGTTYVELRKLFDKILTSSYWSGEKEDVSQQSEQQKTEKQTNVNTSVDDFVIVASSDIDKEEFEREQEKIQQVELIATQTAVQNMENVNVQQNQEQNTFFTTLNRPDNSIKEFLSENNDGLNFLQDSQLHPHKHDNQFQSQDSKSSGDVENQNHGFRKRNDNNGFHQQRNNGGYRKPFNNADNNERKSIGNNRDGSYSGGNRGGYRGGSANNGSNSGFRGGYRGKPRNPGQQYNRECGQQQKFETNEYDKRV